MMKHQSNTIYDVPLEEISALDSSNSRDLFLPESCRELAHDIQRHGLLHPVLLRENSEEELNETGKPYSLVSGFRRLAAFKLNNSVTIPACFKDISKKEARLINISENINREGIGLAKEIDLLRLLIKDGYTLSDVKKVCNKNTAWLYERILIGRLPPDIQEKVYSGELSYRSAVDLAKEHNPAFQQTAFELALMREINRLKKAQRRLNEKHTSSVSIRTRPLKDYQKFYSYIRMKDLDAELMLAILAWAAIKISTQELKSVFEKTYPEVDWTDFPREEINFQL